MLARRHAGFRLPWLKFDDPFFVDTCGCLRRALPLGFGIIKPAVRRCGVDPTWSSLLGRYLALSPTERTLRVQVVLVGTRASFPSHSYHATPARGLPGDPSADADQGAASQGQISYPGKTHLAEPRNAVEAKLGGLGSRPRRPRKDATAQRPQNVQDAITVYLT